MSCTLVSTIVTEAKRSGDKPPLHFDWHDFLAILRHPGIFYAAGVRIRPARRKSTGFEYEATQGGVTADQEPRFPRVIGRSVLDGSVVWTARTISEASLRATIITSEFPGVQGLILSDQSADDMVHTIFAGGGLSGETYKVINRVTLSNAPGEIKEAAMLMDVQD